MARIARVVVPGFPHHITQRGNRRQDVFFRSSDYQFCLELLKEWCAKEGVKIWAYCLMTNLVHLIVKPGENADLSKAIGETRRRYTRMINFRENWRGYLWQGRFASFVMDENWLLRSLAYVELNPVEAGMVENAWDYPWSSVHAHLSGEDPQGIVDTEDLQGLIGDWKSYLLSARGADNADFQQHARTGRPLGNERFLGMAEKRLMRDLRKKKPGPKPKEQN